MYYIWTQFYAHPFGKLTLVLKELPVYLRTWLKITKGQMVERWQKSAFGLPANKQKIDMHTHTLDWVAKISYA